MDGNSEGCLDWGAPNHDMNHNDSDACCRESRRMVLDLGSNQSDDDAYCKRDQ